VKGDVCLKLLRHSNHNYQVFFIEKNIHTKVRSSISRAGESEHLTRTKKLQDWIGLP